MRAYIDAAMYVNKWYTFAVSIICNCSAGLAYCFSLYSNDLKQAFEYDQSQIQAVGSAINLGGYLSVLSGFFYDYWLAYDRLGPRYPEQQTTAQHRARLANQHRLAGHYMPIYLALCRLTVFVGACVNLVGFVLLWAAAKG